MSKNNIPKIVIPSPVQKGEGIVRKSQLLHREVGRYKRPNSQPSLFETLNRTTQKQIINSGLSLGFINERGQALPLEKGHFALIDTLAEILSKRRDNKKDITLEMEKFLGRKEPAPLMVVSLHEITKIFLGTQNPSPKHKKQVNKLLYDLAFNPEFWPLVIKEVAVPLPNNKTKTYKEESFEPLIAITKMTETVTDNDTTNVLEKSSRFTVKLSPIFIYGIDIYEPEGITKLMKEAARPKRTTLVAYRLRYWLSEQRGHRNYSPELKLETLLWKMNQKKMEQRKRKDVQDQINEAIIVMKKIGLLDRVEITTATTDGLPKYIFHLNKNWV